MSREKPIEMITPPNMLKAKLGGALGPIDKSAIARAEAALAALSGEFQNWIEDEVVKLEKSWAAAKAPGADRNASLDKVFSQAHDLKGLGTTYEYPLVTRMAHSLCKLVETEELRNVAPMALVGAHIAAVRAAIRDQIKSDEHPVGKVLVEELEAQVRALAA
jgi:chemotaxis protein histidine kinase CheA